MFKPKGFTPLPTLDNWDASSGGKKFIFVLSQSANAPAMSTRFTVVLNWTEELKRLVPTGK